MILNTYKPKGLTPLQTITLLRKTMPEYANETIGFAGRLDPLAHGVLLLMIGEETTKEKDKFLDLPKEYEFETVFGITTDTYDTLGMLSSQVKNHNVTKQKIEDLLTQFIKTKLGKHMQTYPPYSSKPVNGIPLFQWARAGKLAEIELPKREIEIFDFTLIEIKQLSTEKLKKEIFTQIDSVSGNFRQNEIKQAWTNFFDNTHQQNEFISAHFRIFCSSGTYVRSLANELGKFLGTGAITLDILRTKVGKYSITDSLSLSS
ncbi:MAG TPA: hypothetical protein VLF20_03510 [Patescibacteria group bacterium]|nr:hypothetical protein [Patescibacteria group bacterium]